MTHAGNSVIRERVRQLREAVRKHGDDTPFWNALVEDLQEAERYLDTLAQIKGGK